jgi:hypothetical protein
METLIAQVRQVNSGTPDGKICVTHESISPDTPVYYAGPPQLFSMPGMNDWVMVVKASIKGNQSSWYWINQVAQPQVLGVERETNPWSLWGKATKPPETIEGQDANVEGQALNVFGQVPPDAYTAEHGVPGVVQLRDKRGSRLRMNSKGTEGGGNYVELKSGTGKKLLIEDNAPNFTGGPSPQAFPGKFNGMLNREVPGKNRLLLTDRNGNRVQIDESKDEVQVHSQNRTTLTAAGGEVNMGVTNVNNSGGKARIFNKTTNGTISLECERGGIQATCQTGFEWLSTTSPAPTGVAVVGNTGKYVPEYPLMTPQTILPEVFPSLFMGAGVPMDPLYGTFNGAVAITGPATFAGTTAFAGAQTFTGSNTVDGLLDVNGAASFTGAITEGSTTLHIMNQPTVPLIDFRPVFPLVLAMCPSVTIDGKAIVVVGAL